MARRYLFLVLLYFQASGGATAEGERDKGEPLSFLPAAHPTHAERAWTDPQHLERAI